MRARVVSATVCGLLLLIGGQAGAAGEPDLTRVGVDRLIVTSTGRVRALEMAWNATSNQYLVVWWDERNTATRGFEIYGRRVRADGVPLGSDFLISTSTADEYWPEVTWNATANQYLVVWKDDRNKATRGAEIYGRRVAANGVPIGTDFRISTAITEESSPAAAWNATTNQYLVVWTDYRSETTRNSDIYGRRVGANGVPIGTDFRINSSTGSDGTPKVVWNDTASQYLVVWSDGRSSATRGSDIFGRRIGVDGVLVGTDFRISTATADQTSPEVAWNSTANEYLVVWQDHRSLWTRGAEVYGRRVGAAGVALGSDLRISSSNEWDYTPEVVWNATANRYLVVWGSERSWDTRGREIIGRELDPAGQKLGTADLRISTSITNEDDPAVAWNATSNQYLVVWQDTRDTPASENEIYGRRLAP